MTNEYYAAHTDLVPGTKARSGDINAMDQAIVEAFDKVPSAKNIKIGALNYTTNTSITPDRYEVAMDPVVTSYTPGMEIKLNPVTPNTGPATINVNGLGNIAIKRQDGASLKPGDILAAPIALTYSPTMNAFVIPPTGNAHVLEAAASATAAAASASSAGTSATTASTQAGIATTARQDAQSAASTASTKAGEASASASTASTKASEAVGSANAAATSASAAATSASNLATAVSTATGAATTATTKAGEAATSASNAATSATNLANAVSAAQAAQSLAQQWSSGSGVIANGKYSAEYYATQAQALANAMATGQVQADWNQTDPAQKSFIQNKPAISVAANFAAGNTHTISSEPNTLRAIANPTTGLGYAGGVRFRFGYINDVDSSSGVADIMDFSTYTDNTGGGFNTLYLHKTTQRIYHKFAGAGATSWTVQQIAYLSDLSAYLPLAGGTLSGSLALGATTNNGATLSPTISLPGYSTTPQYRVLINHNFTGILGIGSDGSGAMIFGRATGFNGAPSTEYARFTSSGNMIVGATTEDGSGARVQVAGSVKATSFIGDLTGKAGSVAVRDTAGVSPFNRDAGNIKPNLVNFSVQNDFVIGSTAGMPSNFAGVRTFSPNSGTTGSTGGPSYQTAFGNTANDGSGIPLINHRSGIDTTWNGWWSVMLAGNIPNDGTDFNTLTRCGSYRVQAGFVNGPVGASGYGNALVLNAPGSDTLFQMYGEYTGTMRIRGGNPAGFNGGSGSWSAWARVLDDSINRTNYKGVTDSFVAGQMMWKWGGNNSTVFDASNSTSPTGTTVGNTDPVMLWVPGAPVLMGWNGTNTYGVRVDSARQADTIASGATLTNMVLVKPTFKNYIEQLQALNPGATVTLNPDNGTLIELTTTVSSTTITLPAAVAGASYTLLVKYGSTGHTLTFTGGGLRWADGNTVPTATSVANKIDAYVFTCGTGYTVGRNGWRNA